MPEALRETWPCWRLVNERRATMSELHTTLTIDDVDCALIASDFEHEIERIAHERANR